MAEKDVYILGIESSCDETSAAVVLNGRKCLSNVIASQIELHRRFGGVVPEIAGRNHLLAVMPVVDKALSEAGIGMDKLDAIAVTYGPGLIGCLLVGVAAAKAMAYALGIPLIKTDHSGAYSRQLHSVPAACSASSRARRKRRAYEYRVRGRL